MPTSASFTLSTLYHASMGHAWTVASHLGRRRRQVLGEFEAWSVTLADPLTNTVTLSGVLHTGQRRCHDALDDLVVLIHGLGGSADSGYMLEATNTALRLGFAVLRVSLRGADTLGTDFYHAGLYTDVLEILKHERVRSARNVYLLGVSLGGHVVLRTAGALGLPKNARAAATVCPPLDLAACSAAFDRKRQWVYRRYILESLKQMYVRFAARHPNVCRRLDLPSAKAACEIRGIGEWDRKVVAPRHGFVSAAEYYATQNAGARLGEVHIPTLILTTRWDPMVPHHTTVHLLHPHASTVDTGLGSASTASNRHSAAWVPRPLTRCVSHVELPVGGHVAFAHSGAQDTFTQALVWLRTSAGT
jgi:uncharacterized protein